jgi:hypothetical protein
MFQVRKVLVLASVKKINLIIYITDSVYIPYAKFIVYKF